MCAGRVFHATDALKKKEVVCLVVRAAGRISCLGFLWDRGLREEAKGGRQFVSGSCWRLSKRWSRHKLAISRRQRSDGQSRAWSSSLLGLEGDHHCECAQKWCHFSFLQELSNKKIKALRPKMTKIASRGPALSCFAMFDNQLLTGSSRLKAGAYNQPRLQKAVWEVFSCGCACFTSYVLPAAPKRCARREKRPTGSEANGEEQPKRCI